jgi:sulfate transport system ATP-binding protein
VAYVRPYEVELERRPNGGLAIEAVVRHVSAFGPVVRLELDRAEDGQLIEAELPRGRYRELNLRKGDRIFVLPKQARVFAQEAR